MRRWGAWAVVLVAVLAGCVRPPATDPSQGPTPTAAVDALADPIPLPPRPRDVPLDGVDPCALLTDATRAELAVEETLRSSTRERLYGGGTTEVCTTRGYEPRAISLGVGLVVSAGIERFTTRQVDATVTPIDVRGFPAVELVPDGRPEYCTVIVDVAPGQLIDIQTRPASSEATATSIGSSDGSVAGASPVKVSNESRQPQVGQLRGQWSARNPAASRRATSASTACGSSGGSSIRNARSSTHTGQQPVVGASRSRVA
jgi:hypothetical protein